MGFEVPVVLFLFKRSETLEAIFSRIRAVRPTKVYLIADGPRNQIEAEQTKQCREKAESLIDWKCRVVKFYSDENIGVIYNIGGGAKKVFEEEEVAIFIEDDNLPEISFFQYCKELLDRYKADERILWVCGTNYLGKYNTEYSYMFTQHLLPCGWASWKNKFEKYYDIFLETINNDILKKNFQDSYLSKILYQQQLYSVERTKYLIETNIHHSSWDYQMLYSVRSQKKYGISPCYNQIKNIGVDENSIHGGNTWRNVMVRRLCGMNSYRMEFPLVHPPVVQLDDTYERAISKILQYPVRDQIKRKIATIIKKVFGLNQYDSMAELISRYKGK